MLFHHKSCDEKKKISLKRKTVLGIIILLPLVLILWTLWGNTALMVHRIVISDSRVPPAFSGFRIAHISDLHNTEIGDNNDTLIAMLSACKPDIIVITGDLIDANRTDIPVSLHVAERAVQIAPVYYVSGNHEGCGSFAYEDFKAALIQRGVTVLDDEAVQIESRSGNETLNLIGLADPSFFGHNGILEEESAMVETKTASLFSADSAYTILLCHRPELFDAYVRCGADLVLCGHAHGGQIRLPFIGGLYAPNQGWLPKYDGGLYSEGKTHMVVSRGIGNSTFPLRFYNRPEIVLVELKAQD